MNRRDLLASVGVAGTGLLAGCSGPLPFVSSVVLNGLYITNSESEEHEVRMVVETADEVHLDRTVAVDDGVTLRCDWPDAAGQYTVRARHDGEWRRVEFPGDADGNCHIVEFAIGGPGEWESKLWPCRPGNGARCGYDGHGTPENHQSRR